MSREYKLDTLNQLINEYAQAIKLVEKLARSNKRSPYYVLLKQQRKVLAKLNYLLADIPQIEEPEQPPIPVTRFATQNEPLNKAPKQRVKITATIEAKVRELRTAGMQYQDIAAETGLAQVTARRIVNNKRITGNKPKRLTLEQKAEIQRKRASNSAKQLAAEYGVALTTIYEAFKLKPSVELFDVN